MRVIITLAAAADVAGVREALIEAGFRPHSGKMSLEAAGLLAGACERKDFARLSRLKGVAAVEEDGTVGPLAE
ncbi:hypothetical protein [Roseimicrobium sp. ORNL1]|uniref:hypothetical protein n=1 Tax=Roseimicrobium sp. ORNL1 TaxID=2711231 RepID=UPI0013E19549|nr:hypothetical protein [Roseimicrobium sp. ORNL1]QIF02062.1 hypothetical protein G5S37_11135 [Roseimicrobium sp. ORNL1]